MNSSPRDAELRQILRDADAPSQASGSQLRALSERIMSAAAPVLEARAAAERTIWDYAERWSSVLLQVGAFTTLAAGLCLFAMSGSSDTVSPRASSTRVALIGAATNRVSSQNLLDLLVSTEPAGSTARRGEQ
jgi:hypothetical protein